MKILVVMLFMSIVNSALAMLKINPGQYTLEGYIEKDFKTQKIYFVINKRTNSRIDILLDIKNNQDLNYKDGQKVKLTIKVNEHIYGAQGTADLVKFGNVIHPSRSVLIYNQETDLK